jgi:hypothetical protein
MTIAKTNSRIELGEIIIFPNLIKKLGATTITFINDRFIVVSNIIKIDPEIEPKGNIISLERMKNKGLGFKSYFINHDYLLKNNFILLNRLSDTNGIIIPKRPTKNSIVSFSNDFVNFCVLQTSAPKNIESCAYKKICDSKNENEVYTYLTSQ